MSTEAQEGCSLHFASESSASSNQRVISRLDSRTCEHLGM